MTEIAFIHPETGKVLATLKDFLAAIAAVEVEMQPYWKLRRMLRDGMVERFEPPDMPAPRYRTPTQEKVARCPRCGEKIEEV